MPVQSFALTPGRIDKFKGEILKHAVPMEVLGRLGRQVPMPKNNSDTYVARRWLPYGATAASPSTINQFFQNGTGDRGNVIVQVSAQCVTRVYHESVLAARDARIAELDTLLAQRPAPVPDTTKPATNPFRDFTGDRRRIGR